MKKRVLFIGFGLDPERVEAVSKNTFALQQLLTKELNIEAECLPVSERQSDATGLDKQSFLYCLRNRNMIIDQISGYITKHNITHVHDVFVLSAASIIFTLPLKKLHPNVVFIKEVHNAWGFSKHIHSETIIRILFNSRPYSYIIKRDFDVVITRKVLLAKIEKIIFIPPLIQVFKKRLFKFKNRLSFCYLGHPLVKKGVDEFLKLFEIIPDEIKDKIVFNFAFTPIQFGLQNNILAALDILLVLGTMIWAFRAIWPHMRWVVYLNIPYLLWVSFATALQLTITFLNL